MEFVYVISRSDLFDIRYPQGYLSATGESSKEVRTYLDRVRSNGFFLEREKAESDSSYKQIIPYLVIHHDQQLLRVERLEEQSEDRLHSLLSIGLGGHLNPVDRKEKGSLLKTGIERELEEELHLDTPYQSEFIGVINDDSNDVGSVHFGLSYRIDLQKRNVSIRETERMEGEFQDASALEQKNRESPERFETWSRMLLNNVPDVLVKT